MPHGKGLTRQGGVENDSGEKFAFTHIRQKKTDGIRLFRKFFHYIRSMDVVGLPAAFGTIFV